MFKMSIFKKYFFCFIFAALSMFVFLIDYSVFDPKYLINDSAIVNFFDEFFYSLKIFDFVYVLLFIFILYFYLNTYFDCKKDNKKKNFFCLIFAILFTFMTIVFKSYGIDSTLNSIYASNAQIVKTVLFVVGYYLIYYAIMKKVVYFDIKLLKKKVK